MVVRVEASNGRNSRRTLTSMAWAGARPACRSLLYSSTTTMALSINSPMAMIRPVSDICCNGTSATFSAIITISRVSGSADATMIDDRQPIMISSTATTSPAPINRFVIRLPSRSSVWTLWSKMISAFTPSGRSATNSPTTRRTQAAHLSTRRLFSILTPTMMPGLPSTRTADDGGERGVLVTVATSPTLRIRPSASLRNGMPRMRSMEPISPRTSTTMLLRALSIRPAAFFESARRMASDTALTVSPAEASASASTMTCTSSSGSP